MYSKTGVSRTVLAERGARKIPSDRFRGGGKYDAMFVLISNFKIGMYAMIVGHIYLF